MNAFSLNGRQHVEDFILRAKCFGFLTSVLGAGFGISICGVGSGIYLGFLMLQLLFVRKYDWQPLPFATLAVVLMVSLSVSLFISDYFYISLRGYWKYLAGLFLLYAGIDVIRSRQTARLALMVLLISLTTAMLAGLWQHFFGYDFIYFRGPVVYKDVVPRITGPFKHCNDYATYIVPAFTLVSAFIVISFKKKEYLRVFLFLILFSGFSWMLILTISRGALLATFFSMLIFISFFKFRIYAYPALFLAAFAIALIPSAMSERFLNMFQHSGSASERMILLETTWRMVMENPIFGLGLNTYSDYFPKFRPADYPAIMYAHNSYLQIASEAGLSGCILFFSFQTAVVVSIFRKAVQIRTETQKILVLGLTAGICGIMANAFLESLFQSTQLRTHYWSMLGIAAGIAYQGGFLQDE